MTYAAHTPGPWAWQDGILIGDLDGDGGNVSLTAIGNARLIAAAPDLLKACLDALLVEQVMGDADSELARRLHAAIVKAQGELA
jgi:hypothetical protein